MYRPFAALLSVVVVTGCSMSSTVEVSVTPHLNASMGDDLKILARSSATSDLTCKVFEAPYEAGRFVLDGLCKDTTYTLELTEPSLLVQGDMKLTATGEPMTTALELWPAPAGSGVAMLKPDGSLKAVGHYTDVQTVKTDDEEQLAVRYPRHKPNGAHHVDDGGHLVIAGQALADRLEFLPLIESTEERGFSGYTLGPHWFAGVRFDSDTEYEKVSAELSTGKVTDVIGADGRVVRYIAHDALPAGHYALLGPDDKRMYVVTFGPSEAPAAASN